MKRRVNYESFIGTRHKALVVLSIDGTEKSGRTVFPAYLVQCDCGSTKRVCAREIVYRRIISCGCRIGTKTGRYEKRAANNPKWRGGSITEADGRTLIYCPDHPLPNHSGIYVYRYRLIMEKHLGRFLLKSELVHHKNGNCTDDRLENLEVTSRSDHARRHRVPQHRRFVDLKLSAAKASATHGT